MEESNITSEILPTEQESIANEGSSGERESTITYGRGDGEDVSSMLSEQGAIEQESTIVSAGDTTGSDSSIHKVTQVDDLNVGHDATIGGTLKAYKESLPKSDRPLKDGTGIYSDGAAYAYTPTQIEKDTTNISLGVLGLRLLNAAGVAVGGWTDIPVGMSDKDRAGIDAGMSQLLAAISGRYLRKDSQDTAQGVITFLQGLTAQEVATFQKLIIAQGGIQLGDTFVPGLVGKGGKIDGEGRGEMRSLRLWESLEVPEIRYNRVSVYTGIRWDTFGGGIIETVTPDSTGAETGTCTLKLEDGEYGAIGVGDLCMGIWHDTTGNSTESKDDNKGNFLFKGFKTVYFQITGVSGENNGTFTYMLRSSADGGNGIHPFPFMHFAGRGNIENEERQSFTYTTTEYTVSLTDVKTWEFQAENYYSLHGHIEGFSMPAVDSNGNKYTKTFHGYGNVMGNAYIFGNIDRFERVGYRMFIDQSLNGSMSPTDKDGETVTCTILDGYNHDCTSQFTLYSVTRNSGDSASDAIWNQSHTNVGNPFKIAYSDLGIDGIHRLLVTFTVTATDEATDSKAAKSIDFQS